MLHWTDLTLDLSLVNTHHSRNVIVKHKHICVPSNEWFLLVSIREHYSTTNDFVSGLLNDLTTNLNQHCSAMSITSFVKLNILSGSLTLCLIYTEGLSTIAGKVTALRFPINFKVLIGGNSLVELFYC